MEDWFHELLKSSAQSGEADGACSTPQTEPRCMFIVSADHGELALCMYFVLGQSFACRSTILLPPGLHTTNGDTLPERTRSYDSVNDIVDAVNTERPDIVFLFSGYLLAVNRIASLAELKHLLEALRESGCSIVTSDPFLGLATQMRESTTASMLGTDLVRAHSPLRAARHWVLDRLRERRLHQQLIHSARLLDDAYHLYPSPTGTCRTSRDLAFFNPRLIVPGPHARESADRHAGARPYWTFVLAAHDFSVQSAIHGREEFISNLQRMLDDALAAHRDAVLIAPGECVDALSPHISDTEQVRLLSFCAFTRFAPLALGAEFVFYWNVISASMVLRLFNELPVFFFDRGHFARRVKPIHEMAIRSYFHGCPPMMLDPLNRLSPDMLGARADRYRARARTIREAYARAQTPAQVVARMLDRVAEARIDSAR